MNARENIYFKSNYLKISETTETKLKQNKTLTHSSSFLSAQIRNFM